MSAETRDALMAVDSCDCPLIAGQHKYGVGCLTACPDCESLSRCVHDEDEA